MFYVADKQNDERSQSNWECCFRLVAEGIVSVRTNVTVNHNSVPRSIGTSVVSDRTGFRFMGRAISILVM